LGPGKPGRILNDDERLGDEFDYLRCRRNRAVPKKGFGKRIMKELMARAPGSRFYLTSTFGSEDFYRKLGFKKHKTAFALYPSESPYFEEA
jgi:histone acetyltransferase (RNA polymerase elongator complex component)